MDDGGIISFRLYINKYIYTLISLIVPILLYISMLDDVGAMPLVNPKKVILTDSQPYGSVKFFNTSDTKFEFRISMVNMTVNDDGSYNMVQDNAEKLDYFADDMLIFSPRSIILEPRESQLIRMQFRSPNDISDGEYRSHLSIRQIRAITEDKVSDENGDSVSTSVSIMPLFGVTIPVIIRKGDTYAKVQITEVSITIPTVDKKKNLLTFNAIREGNQSISGSVLISKRPHSFRQEDIVAQIHNVNVLYPSKLRTVVVNIPDSVLENFKGLVYISYYNRDNPSEIFASSQIVLQDTN